MANEQLIWLQAIKTQFISCIPASDEQMSLCTFRGDTSVDLAAICVKANGNAADHFFHVCKCQTLVA